MGSMKKCVDAVEANPPYVKMEKKEEAKVEPKKEEAKVEEKKEEAKTELKKDGTDFKLITSLLEFHPKGAEKRKGLVGIKVAKSEYGDSRCFYMVRDDGSSEDVSMKKCVDAVEANPPYVKIEKKEEEPKKEVKQVEKKEDKKEEKKEGAKVEEK